MQIVQTVFGVFHHFELARELERRGHLRRVYSTWPWARLKREGLATRQGRNLPLAARPRVPRRPRARRSHLAPRPARLRQRPRLRPLDRAPARPRAASADGSKIDALIGISGSSLRAGALVQRTGGVFICDRGSTHQRYQEQTPRRRVPPLGRRHAALRPARHPPRGGHLRRRRRHHRALHRGRALLRRDGRAARTRSTSSPTACASRASSRPPNLRPTPSTSSSPAAVGLRKGVPYLLEAFARLRHPHKRLRIVGAVQEDIRAVLPKPPDGERRDARLRCRSPSSPR